MNCRHVQSHLSAFLDSELSGQEMIQFRDHLANCPTCRAEEFEVRNLKALLAGAPIVEPPADFESKLFTAVMASAAPQRRSIPSLTMLSGVAAAAMACTLLALNIASQNDAARETSRQAETIAFEVQRDQVTSAGMDPLGASNPVILPTTYGNR